VEALVVSGMLEGFGVLAQRASNCTIRSLWVFFKIPYES
jgi:hypothetical protein